MISPLQHAPPPERPPVVLAVFGGKGGTGKTQVALGLADVWATAGRRVALVDLDPQGGATLAAGLARADAPLSTAGEPCHGFWLFPSGRALASATTHQLTQRIALAEAVADWVVLDLSPALTDAGHAAALRRSTFAVVVARTDGAGLPNVAEAVQLAMDLSLPFLVVPSMRGHTALAREAEAFLRGRYGDRVAAMALPHDARAAEAAAAGRPVTRAARTAKVSVAIRALASELFERVEAAP